MQQERKLVRLIAFLVGALGVVVNAQLDLPSMPGPPYPDPRGQNRWGVKFDPRKHGPPYDKRGSTQSNVYHRAPPHPGGPPLSQHRMRLRSRRRDSYWSPTKLRAHHRSSNRRNRNRHYDNDLRKRRPRTYMKAYKEMEAWDGKRPHLEGKPENQEFWNVWNKWYRKQEEAKKMMTPYSHDQGPTYLIDAEEFSNIYLDNEEEEEGEKEEEEDGWRWKGPRPTSVFSGMKEMYKKAKKSLVFAEEEQKEEESKSHESKDVERWEIFTTLGKGLDAANDAMGSVRKTVGGSLLGTGIKYGGKMALGAVMNVGTSALTTAIQSASPFG